MFNLNLVVLVLVIVVVAGYYYSEHNNKQMTVTPQHNNTEMFHNDMHNNNYDPIKPFDPMHNDNMETSVYNIDMDHDVEVYDDSTNKSVSSNELLNENVVIPKWISPAWEPTQHPQSNLENDERMIYNKCSLSCCSSQYPLPFKTNQSLLDNTTQTSQMTCHNGLGGSGCLCCVIKQ